MPVVKCPACGEVIHSDDLIPVRRLSPAAQHILTKGPRAFLSGKRIIPIRTIAHTTGYSIAQTHYALRELANAGYIERIPRGKTGKRHVYQGVPERLPAVMV